jgi:geranylgeranyl diphosphate synthase, type II
MDVPSRIEQALRVALAPLGAPGAPPRLTTALYHSVFPGGGRVRPQLCLRVALARGEDSAGIVDGAAAALELVHCASLVHDDLPCFDDASTRRGQPSTHRAYGVPLAVLAGDQLIVLAFEMLARTASASPERLGKLVVALGRGVGLPHGVIAGQGWEGEPSIPSALYRRAKTGALFEAAAVCGAFATGASEDEAHAWRSFGQLIGEAYQVADDLLDVLSDPVSAGKPVGRDAVLGRPNVAHDLGLRASTDLFEELVHNAQKVIPHCPGRDDLCAWTAGVIERIRPRQRVVEESPQPQLSTGTD